MFDDLIDFSYSNDSGLSDELDTEHFFHSQSHFNLNFLIQNGHFKFIIGIQKLIIVNFILYIEVQIWTDMYDIAVVYPSKALVVTFVIIDYLDILLNRIWLDIFM